MSVIFLSVALGIPLLSIAWTVWADRRLKSLAAPRLLRTASIVAMLLIVAALSWIILARLEITPKVPPFIYSLVLLWGLIYLPFLAFPIMMGWSVLSIVRAVSGSRKSPATADVPTDGSRRKFIGSAIVALPAVATFGTAMISIPQRTRFRVREITVPIAGLPQDLHGLRIAHVSDTHVGKFTNGRILNELADATNRLKADLVLLTGDLIDQSLDDLPEALDMVGRLDPRSGLYLIEGNHDLFQGAEKFAKGVRDGGFNLLRNENAVLDVKGHPLELLGIRWDRKSHDPLVEETFRKRDPGAFPMLLAHHPHAFDAAAKLGIPLTLAGHTHGGQLMLTPEIGAGPMMFKYWSGLYRQGDSSLVVSNGAGNWFPVRTAAPAEIVHITLVRV